jgi:hypothetical protein
MDISPLPLLLLIYVLHAIFNLEEINLKSRKYWGANGKEKGRSSEKVYKSKKGERKPRKGVRGNISNDHGRGREKLYIFQMGRYDFRT